MIGFATVTAQQFAVGIRSDHRDGGELPGIKRQQMVFILQQRDSLSGALEGQLPVGVRTHHALRLAGVDIRMLEQAQLEFPIEHGGHELVQVGLFQHLLPDELHQMEIAVRLRKLDIDARPHGQDAGFRLVVGHKMAMGVGAMAQFPDGVVVRHHKAGEAPFLPQDVTQQPLAGVRRHPVNFVITSHHADGARLADGRLERIQERFAQHAQGNVHRPAVLAGFRLAVRGKMLQGGDDMLPVLEGFIPLKSAHRRHPQLGHQIRIFAKGFLHPAPARITRHVHDRR